MEDKICKVVEKHRRLLELEQAAEEAEEQVYLSSLTKQQLQRRGIAIFGLRLLGQRTGLGGKCIITLGPFQVSANKRGASNDIRLPAHTFKVGDVAQISAGGEMGPMIKKSGKEEGQTAPTATVSGGQPLVFQGVVSKVSDDSLCIALTEDIPHEWENATLRIIRLANQVTFKRMHQGLDLLEKSGGQSSGLLDAIFGDQLYSEFLSKEEEDAIISTTANFHNPNLNTSQRRAVVHSLLSPYLALVHGPPGTGKTETLTEIIQQTLKPRIAATSAASPQQRSKILVCGPSNLSVDNVLERLVDYDQNIDVIRVGHPARVLEAVQQHALDIRLATHETSSLIRDIRSEIDAAVKSINRPGVKNRREIYSELKFLRKELKERETGAINTLLGGKTIALATLNMSGGSILRGRPFDVVIIDEAGQALEAECWLAMMRAQKVILAGDHLQLPPTITSERAMKEGLGLTLFERLVRRFQPKPTQLLSQLEIQYRMHETICRWTSQEFYNGMLMAHDSVAKHRLCDLPGVESIEETESVFQFIDTAGFDFNESVEEEDQSSLPDGKDQLSKYNENEAKVAIRHALTLIEAGIPAKEIAIITPYNAQVAFLRSLSAHYEWNKDLEIGSVDGFQGREKEAIIISFVRSNPKGEIGFLSETRRTNVAITRARRQVCCIGDSETLSRNPFYKRLIEFINQHGDYTYPAI